MNIEKAIREYIEDNGIKQSFICEKTGMSPAIFSRVYCGERKLRASEFISICDVLNVDPRMFARTE